LSTENVFPFFAPPLTTAIIVYRPLPPSSFFSYSLF
jgi:hypothetical protein